LRSEVHPPALGGLPEKWSLWPVSRSANSSVAPAMPSTMMALPGSCVIERHLGSPAQPSAIRAVTPRLTRDLHAKSGSNCGKLSIRSLRGERAASIV